MLHGSTKPSENVLRLCFGVIASSILLDGLWGVDHHNLSFGCVIYGPLERSVSVEQTFSGQLTSKNKTIPWHNIIYIANCAISCHVIHHVLGSNVDVDNKYFVNGYSMSYSPQDNVK